MEKIEIKTIPIIFKTNPYFTIWFTCKYPEEKTIAFGGVPTGSINAKLAPNVKGMQSWVIGIPISIANFATIGTKILTIAKLDNTSDAKTATMTNTKSKP